ncbi:hypothetical protein MASR2M29_10190 [Spirochaetota bacterium]
MNKLAWLFAGCFIFILSPLLLASCVSEPSSAPARTLSTTSEISQLLQKKKQIEDALAMGSPGSLEQVLELTQEGASIPESDSKAYAWLAYEMARLVYPEISADLPSTNITPPDSNLVKAFIDARNGKISTAITDSGPLYELFPSLVIFRLKTPAASGAALTALERYSRFAQASALAELVRGLALERSGDLGAALSAYTKAESLAPDCYPASMGRARIFLEQSKGQAALDALASLGSSLNDNSQVKRLRALALYQEKRWDEAWPLVTAVLLADPMDSKFLLIRAHMLVERGEYKQAAPLLDAYASLNPGDRLYIMLRARSSFESAKDRKAAIAALKTGMQKYPDDTEMMGYGAELMWGGDKEEKQEAVRISDRLLSLDPDNPKAIRVLLSSSLADGDNEKAASIADRIQASGIIFTDYEALYKAYYRAGRLTEAAKMAEKWRTKEPLSEPAAIASVTVLLDSGKKQEAAQLIGKLLAIKGSSSYRSSLYWLQSRTQGNDEAVLSSLRSALVENGMNIDALAAISDFYIKKEDYQKARFYLKQAISIAPDRPDIASQRDKLLQQGLAFP